MNPWAVTQVGIWVACAVVVIVAFVRAWPWIRKAFKLVDALTGLPEFIDAQGDFREKTDATLAAQNRTLTTQNATLDTIKHELFPNSGTSLRDAVDGLVTDVASINEKLASDNERITDLENPRKPD